MKKPIYIALIMSLCFMGVAQAKEFESQKFTAVYTIQFNSVTLEEASRLEDVIKKKFKNACEIRVKLEDGEMLTFVTNDTNDTVLTDEYILNWRKHD